MASTQTRPITGKDTAAPVQRELATRRQLEGASVAKQREFTTTRRAPMRMRMRVPEHRSQKPVTTVPCSSRTAIYLLMLLTAGAYIPSPLYPAYQDVFGFSDLTLTLIYAAFAVISAPALLIFGSTYDTYGPRPVLRLSVIAAIAGSLCFLVAPGPAWLLAGRIAHGIALGAVTAAASALIVSGPGRAGGKRASLVASVAFVAGTAVGPLAAGAVASFLPDPLALPYIVHLGLLVYAWARVEKLPANKAAAGRWRPTWPSVPRGIRTVFATAAGTGFLAWMAAGIFLALGPSLLLRYGLGHRQSSPSQASAPAMTSQLPEPLQDMALIHTIDSLLPVLGGALVALVLACSVIAQLLSVRMNARAAQTTGAGMLVAALAALALTGTSASLAVFLIVSAVAGIGHGFAYRGAAAHVDAITPNECRGGVTATLYLAFYLGTGIPTIAVGVITSWYPLTTAVSWLAWVGTALSVVTVIVTLAHRRSRLVHNRTERHAHHRAGRSRQHPIRATRPRRIRHRLPHG